MLPSNVIAVATVPAAGAIITATGAGVAMGSDGEPTSGVGGVAMGSDGEPGSRVGVTVGTTGCRVGVGETGIGVGAGAIGTGELE